MTDKTGFQTLLDIIKRRDQEIDALRRANLDLLKRKKKVEVRAVRFELAFDSAVNTIVKLKNRHLLTSRINARTGKSPRAINRCFIRSGNVMRIRANRPTRGFEFTAIAPKEQTGSRYGNPKRR